MKFLSALPAVAVIAIVGYYTATSSLARAESTPALPRLEVAEGDDAKIPGGQLPIDGFEVDFDAGADEPSANCDAGRTGCASITFADDREQPKHPNLPSPPPSGWQSRRPAYGLPRSALTPTGCRWNATFRSATCTTMIGGRSYAVECRRHLPGGTGDPGGAACRMHCYFDLI